MPPVSDSPILHLKDYGRIETNLDDARQLIESLSELGINLDQMMTDLLDEGIDKFIKPFDKLMDSLVTKVNQLTPV